MNVISFDMWSDYANFRRGYTTTSTISYPFPSRTTISGIVSSILGYKKDSYYDIFQKNNSKIGLRILNPIKKVKMNLNYINTKKDINLFDVTENGKRTQVPAEYIKDPKYRFYISLDDDEKMETLYELLKSHESIYTPCLGTSECLSNFEIVGDKIYSVESQQGEMVDIDSVVLKDTGNIVIEKGKHYGIVKSPGFFSDKRRIVSSFLEYYYESNANPIKLESCNFYKIGEDNVILY